MSERGSFTTQYFYNDSDYKTIRNALDRKSKFLCVSPPATWNNGYQDLEETVVSGKVGESAMNCEWLTIVDAIYGVKTKEEVRIVVMCDGGSIILITKDPSGETNSQILVPEVDEAEKYGEWKKLDVAKYRCMNCGKIQYADDVNELNYCCNCGSRNKVHERLGEILNEVTE